jgi:hypothetical protein
LCIVVLTENELDNIFGYFSQTHLVTVPLPLNFKVQNQ